MAKLFRSSVEITVAPASPGLETHKVFDRNYSAFVGSPIDEFTNRIRSLNSLAPRPDSFDPYLGQLVLLGGVAAVESFLRAVFRRCIASDPVSKAAAMKKDVTYAAALHLSKELLPEALLERISFTSADNIERACRELLGISGDFPQDFKSVVAEYVRVCHLRHCAVHRFGKLGASNAVHLGIDEHIELLEKPLLLNYTALQNSIAIISAFARVFNSFVFNALISRTAEADFSGVYADDKLKFGVYYAIFQDKVSISKSPAPKAAYSEFFAQRALFFSPRQARGGA